VKYQIIPRKNDLDTATYQAYLQTLPLCVEYPLRAKKLPTPPLRRKTFDPVSLSNEAYFTQLQQSGARGGTAPPRSLTLSASNVVTGSESHNVASESATAQSTSTTTTAEQPLSDGDSNASSTPLSSPHQPAADGGEKAEGDGAISPRSLSTATSPDSTPVKRERRVTKSATTIGSTHTEVVLTPEEKAANEKKVKNAVLVLIYV
jgi:hypothetical protein